MSASKLVTIAVISFCIIYGTMDNPVPCMTELVCAAAHKPPKDVTPSTNGNTTVKDKPDPVISEMPFEISKVGRSHQNGRRFPNEIKMENSII